MERSGDLGFGCRVGCGGVAGGPLPDPSAWWGPLWVVALLPLVAAVSQDGESEAAWFTGFGGDGKPGARSGAALAVFDRPALR